MHRAGSAIGSLEGMINMIPVIYTKAIPKIKM